MLSGLEDAQHAPSEGSLETFHSPKLAKIGNTSFLGPIDQRCEGYWVERRDGRIAVLHKGKKPNEITPE